MSVRKFTGPPHANLLSASDPKELAALPAAGGKRATGINGAATRSPTNAWRSTSLGKTLALAATDPGKAGGATSRASVPVTSAPRPSDGRASGTSSCARTAVSQQASIPNELAAPLTPEGAEADGGMRVVMGATEQDALAAFEHGVTELVPSKAGGNASNNDVGTSSTDPVAEAPTSAPCAEAGAWGSAACAVNSPDVSMVSARGDSACAWRAARSTAVLTNTASSELAACEQRDAALTPPQDGANAGCNKPTCGTVGSSASLATSEGLAALPSSPGPMGAKDVHDMTSCGASRPAAAACAASPVRPSDSDGVATSALSGISATSACATSSSTNATATTSCGCGAAKASKPTNEVVAVAVRGDA